MKILRSFSELAAARNQIKGKLGLVPTMGALHDGHLTLVKKIKAKTEAVMVSIFVNPAQFAPGEDFKTYPRREAEDLEKLEGLADYVYVPKQEDIYPQGFNSFIKAGDEGKGLEGEFRPGHFDGAATVVNILFKQIRPTHAIFGEKDYQQLMVIKQMVAEYGLPVAILSGETVREPDGLALSSRNIYLSPEERKLAPLLYKYMSEYRIDAVDKLKSAGFKVQYLEQHWGRLLAAAYLGKTRLIDNIPIS